MHTSHTAENKDTLSITHTHSSFIFYLVNITLSKRDETDSIPGKRANKVISQNDSYYIVIITYYYQTIIMFIPGDVLLGDLLQKYFRFMFS